MTSPLAAFGPAKTRGTSRTLEERNHSHWLPGFSGAWFSFAWEAENGQMDETRLLLRSMQHPGRSPAWKGGTFSARNGGDMRKFWGVSSPGEVGFRRKTHEDTMANERVDIARRKGRQDADEKRVKVRRSGESQTHGVSRGSCHPIGSCS